MTVIGCASGLQLGCAAPHCMHQQAMQGFANPGAVLLGCHAAPQQSIITGVMLHTSARQLASLCKADKASLARHTTSEPATTCMPLSAPLAAHSRGSHEHDCRCSQRQEARQIVASVSTLWRSAREIVLLPAGGTERFTVALVSQVMRMQAPQPDCGRPATTGLSLAVAPIAPLGLSDPYPQLPSVVAPRCARKAGSGQH